MPKNLWGELPTKLLRTPATVLKEQASLLAEATAGTLLGIVQTFKSDLGNLTHRLSVRVPALSNYEVSILEIRHQITLYPCRVIDRHGDADAQDVNDEGELDGALEAILCSMRVRQLILALLSQAKVETE
jgi:hypothetical protein